MYIKIHNQHDDDTIYANVRLRADQWRSLRKHLRADEHPNADPTICVFPYGARLVKQGRGWYKLVNYRTVRGIDKIEAAVQRLHSWYRKYDADRTQLIFQLIRPIAAEAVQHQQQAPEINGKLQRLLHKFGRQNANRPAYP